MIRSLYIQILLSLVMIKVECAHNKYSGKIKPDQKQYLFSLGLQNEAYPQWPKNTIEFCPTAQEKFGLDGLINICGHLGMLIQHILKTILHSPKLDQISPYLNYVIYFP